MILTDLHTHTVFSDGANTPEEMAQSAVLKGVKVLGFSDHSYTSIDESYCLHINDYPKYIAAVAALKEEYKDRLEILCGIEQDYYSDAPIEGFDYVIGSVHYVKAGDEYIPVDDTAEILKNAADKYFDGDVYALIEAYYITVADVVNKTNCDIIGHFDLISKFNENGDLFDENDPRYVAAYRYAADELLKTGRPFEINTGAISRGYRTTPYPSKQIMEYLKSRGASFILSSDSHSAETLCYMFNKFGLSDGEGT